NVRGLLRHANAPADLNLSIRATGKAEPRDRKVRPDLRWRATAQTTRGPSPSQSEHRRLYWGSDMPAHVRPRLAIRAGCRQQTAATPGPLRVLLLPPTRVPTLRERCCPRDADAVVALVDVPRRSEPVRFATEAPALPARSHRPN